MTLSFQSLAKQHNKISLDEIAQLSLTSIPQLKFFSEFHKDMIEISTSAEQIERSENVNLLIYDILKAKEFTISHEGRLATVENLSNERSSLIIYLIYSFFYYIIHIIILFKGLLCSRFVLLSRIMKER